MEKQDFNDKKFWQKLTDYAKTAGQKTIYTALLLYYAFRRKETPNWAKGVVVGALGYFISPIDAIPDLTPFLGYTDDLGVMMMGLVTISAYINDEVRGNAKKQLEKWFKNPDEELITEIDSKL